MTFDMHLSTSIFEAIPDIGLQNFNSFTLISDQNLIDLLW